MVWFLLGVLFNAAGLYLGFEYRLAFVYMIVGGFCCAYGVALFAFLLRERPRTTAATRLSPNFISSGATVIVPSPAANDSAGPTESSDTG
jgi:hypothetical protein